MKTFALTTIDNPFHPIEQFDDWLNFDLRFGYNCWSYVMRIARTSDSFSDEENQREIERAIDEIIKRDPNDIYIKVVSET